VQLGIDTQAYNAAVTNGLNPEITNVFQPDSPMYDERTKLPEYDPVAAQALFDEVAAEKGGPVKITLYMADVFRPMTDALQTQLLAYDNVEVDVQTQPFTQWVSARATGDFDTTYNNTAFDDPEPDLFDGFDTQGAKNFGGLSDPIIDEALAAGRATDDPEARKEAYVSVMERVNEQAYAVFISSANGAVLLTPRVQNFGRMGDLIPILSQIWLADE
jgi:ABC-type transport system substrate-binding protein